MYLSCAEPNNLQALCHTLPLLEACISDIRRWMPLNGLKLNDGKTEFCTLCSHHQLLPSATPIEIGSNLINPSPTAKNLCVMTDETLTLQPHIPNLCKAAYFHIRRISHIRCFLMTEATKPLVHSLISSHLDYYNSILAGLPVPNIAKLQSVQNAVARLIVHGNKYDQISPTLRSFHWLPVDQRMLFKVLVLTYKALNDLAASYIKSSLQSTPLPGVLGPPQLSL